MAAALSFYATFSLTPMQTIFVADAYCGGGKRFVVRADEKLTAFIELESAIKRDHPEILRTL